MLHHFDQSLQSAWALPRAPIPKVMHLIKEELGELVRTYYHMKKAPRDEDDLYRQYFQPLDKE